jgi:DHA1 family bicyclomycin/chloramphenicol resistance-like MFS transporter
LSDKYGRKPILLVGMVLYTVSSLLCVFAVSVEQLVAYRVVQALGCGAATAVSTAMIKDSFTGRERGRTLAIVQTLSTTSPVVSPVIGAMILGSFSWPGVFVVFTVVGVISLAGGLMLQETLVQRSSVPVLHTVARLGTVAQNKGLKSLLFLFAFLQIPFLGFITASAFIYIDIFHVSEQVYSYYFAANAVFLLLGPLVYLLVVRHLGYRKMITIAYVVIGVCGLLVVLFGHLGPGVFCLLFIPISLFSNASGPPRMSLMLEQVTGDTGSAVSLVSAVQMAFGCLGMFLMPLAGSLQIEVLGGAYLVIAGGSLGVWRWLMHQPFLKPLPE